jgi:hypothetical protein
MFTGCCLEEHEAALVHSSADDQVLECANTSENGVWIRKCSIFNGEAGLRPLLIEAPPLGRAAAPNGPADEGP